MTTPSVTKRRQRGPNDPDRAGRIARAAVQVVAEYGVDGLTHRKVAAVAEVPLGSTTYHYSTLDDLLAAALAHASARSVEALRAWEKNLPDNVDLASALTDFTLWSVCEHREDTMAEYNLYALALHRRHLRAAAVEWDDALAEVLRNRTDAVTGKMLGMLLCGLIMQVVLRDDALSRSDVERVLRRAIGSPQ